MVQTSQSNFSDLYRSHVETITARAQRALAEQGYDGVVIHSGRLQRKSPFDDQDWPFRPVPMFAHWSPLRWPDSAVIVTAHGVELCALEVTDFWEKPAVPDWDLLRSGMKVRTIQRAEHTKASLPVGKVAFIGHEGEVAHELGLDPEHVNPGGLRVALEDTRVEKTAYEVRMMTEASLRGARGHRRVEAEFLAGERSELLLHLAFLQASQQDDADAPYKGIVALGRAAATLHHNVYEDRPGAGSLLVDAGATFHGYPCDITRTHCAPTASEAFKDLKAAMEDLQRETIEDIEVGKGYEDLHDACHRRLADVLVAHGLVTCSPAATVDQGLTRAFFPHGLGHSLGVQVHDVSCRKREPRPENRFLRHTGTITAGQVFTIEPGLYFIDRLLEPLRASPAGADVAWDTVAALAPYGGIRIEDNIHVTPAGIRNLTREAFASTSEYD